MRSKRNDSRGDRGRSLDRRANALLAIVGIGATAIGVWTWMAPGVDAQGCARTGPSALLGIIVDATDTLSEAQRLDATNRLRGVMETLPAGTAVQMWRVAPTEDDVPMPIEAPVCTPDANPTGVTTNLTTARRRIAQFDETVARWLDQSLAAGGERQSPIFETIQAVSLRFLNTPAHRQVPDRRLLLVSDLVQNTRAWSQTGRVEPFERFAESPLRVRLGADLAGVNVTVLLLHRPVPARAAEHVQFWQQFFAASGATLEYVHRIVG